MIFPSSLMYSYYAEVAGLLAPDFFSNFIFAVSFSFFRPTNPKSENPYDNNQKKGMAYLVLSVNMKRFLSWETSGRKM